MKLMLSKKELILNPKTGRYVKRSGKIGKALQSKSSERGLYSISKKVADSLLRNPLSRARILGNNGKGDTPKLARIGRLLQYMDEIGWE